MAGNSSDGYQLAAENERPAVGAPLTPRPVIVTTSWDDGHKHDRRLAEMLAKHGLSGTFYVSPFSREFSSRDLLTESEIRDLSDSFEVGSHTLTHPVLPEISLASAAAEISESKTHLENITGKPTTSFCYPRGAYLPAHREIVRESGYLYARTVTRYSFAVTDPYQAPTSIHAYDHWSDLWRMARFSSFNVVDFLRYRQWHHLSNAMFDHVLAAGGVYHLWGHSWEIDAHDDWQRLDMALSYLSGHPGVRYVTNGELLAALPQRQFRPTSG